MRRIIKSFADGSSLEYDSGNFDNWCVYLTRPNAQRRAPRDVDYFTEIKRYAEKYGAHRIYSDYVRVYDFTGKAIEPAKLADISRITAAYGEDAVEMDIIFTTLYMGMIAEEQKQHTRLGKRIKRLGVHMLLMENCGPAYSANSTRGMKWTEIDALCKARGF